MKKIAVIYILAILLIGYSSKTKLHTAPMDDSFYEATRFIMTKEEKEIYKHLPDQKAKDEFIEEFWKKRDPSPDTEENENKIEFEKRIQFANQWFKERPDGRGWNTDRGRILLQLGFPNERTVRVTTRRGTTWQVNIEEWHYYDYKLWLRFIEDFAQGRYRLYYWPALLRVTLEKAKFTMDLSDREALKKKFKFKVKLKKNTIIITIPVKKIQFEYEEKADKMNARFEIEIFIYLNFEKVDHIKREETVSRTKEDILKQSTIEMKIPYSLSLKGKYYFDVIIKDILTGSRYRNFCKFKNSGF